MANTILRSGQQNKVYQALGLLCLMVLAQKGGAYEFKVGGSGGWAVPADSNTVSYNKWAESKRFQIGDSLVFDYPAGSDSVLQVSSEDYTNCNTASPIASYSDGHTVFTFNHSGPHHFISGNKDNCLKNEKLVVVVMADRSGRSSASPPPSDDTTVPSPPPSDDTVPSPAPSGEDSPSPPAGTVEINPTPAPASDSDHPPPPPPSAASSILVSLGASLGVLTASTIVLAF